MQTTTAPHPSRTVPLCKDCVHLARDHRGEFHERRPYCNHPAMPVALTTGEPNTLTHEARDSVGLCGPTAKLFDCSPSANCPRCHGKGRIAVRGESVCIEYPHCPECRPDAAEPCAD